MKTLQKIILLFIIMITSLFSKAQKFAINGDSLTSLSHATLYYCPNELTVINLGSCDTVIFTLYNPNTTTNNIIILTKLNPTSQINPSLYAWVSSNIHVINYQGDTGTNYGITLKPQIITTKINTTLDSLVCGKVATLTALPTGADTSNVKNILWSYNNIISNPLLNVGITGDSTRYKAYITLTNGCLDTATISLYHKTLSGSVCWTTVDTSSRHNIIIWNTNSISNQAIDSLKLYYLSDINPMTWTLIGEESYTTANEFFIDSVNNPNVTNVTYRITTVDSCGDEEPFSNSPYQTTMKIIPNGTGTFSWASSGYAIENNATPVSEYFLYRNNVLIDSAIGTRSSITDPNYSPSATYYVTAKLNIDLCALSPIAEGERVMGNSLTQTRSNSYNETVNSIENITNAQQAKVYPNPFTNTINVDVKQHSIVELVDVTGRNIYTSVFETGHNTINEELPSGVYFLRINGTSVTKLVK